MIIPIIVLLASMFLIYTFLATVILKWIEMNCFWGRVAFRQGDGQKFDIQYSFTISVWALVGFVLAIPGMLWSVIKLAMLL